MQWKNFLSRYDERNCVEKRYTFPHISVGVSTLIHNGDNEKHHFLEVKQHPAELTLGRRTSRDNCQQLSLFGVVLVCGEVLERAVLRNQRQCKRVGCWRSQSVQKQWLLKAASIPLHHQSIDRLASAKCGRKCPPSPPPHLPRLAWGNMTRRYFFMAFYTMTATLWTLL